MSPDQALKSPASANGERIYQVASAILASTDAVPVGRAILVAELIVQLFVNLEKYKYEAQEQHIHR